MSCAKAEFKPYIAPRRSFLCNEFTNLHMIVKRLLPNYFKTLGEGPVREKTQEKNTIGANPVGSEPLTSQSRVRECYH